MDNTQPNWHAVTAQRAIDRLSASADGLSSEQAQNRLQQYGPNQIQHMEPPSKLRIFLRQFNNLLIYVLLIAALITLSLAHWVDAGVILGVVIINAIIGFIQEHRAERALESIRHLLTPSALVLRDGERKQISSRDVVPGDIVLLRSGDKVPADLRLFDLKNLQVQEATLTGESMPVDKDTDPVGESAVIQERQCMAYAGTLVTYGKGRGIVTTTGEHTEMGRIAELLRQTTGIKTPLIGQINRFSRWLTLIILVLTAFTFSHGLWVHGYQINEIFMAAVSLAVAAIPEGLPAVLTVTLALGVTRIARQNAIVRSLPAVETLGAVSVICTDKTGTLTRNELTAKHVVTANGEYEVEGSGYQPVGGFLRNGQPVSLTDHDTFKETITAGLLCNDGQLKPDEQGNWQLQGNPTDGALLTLGFKAGLDYNQLHAQYPASDYIPFESVHKFMATQHRFNGQGEIIYIKGAPEQILERCTQQASGDGVESINKAFWESKIHELTRQGYRVIALARKPARGHTALTINDVESELTLLGMTGMLDPPREQVPDAVEQCYRAGIDIKMITGDHAQTASAIAQQIGIQFDNVLTGADIDRCSDHELVSAVQTTNVFARTSPEHKLRLVKALQSLGKRVAMTGDGVNDSPALKQAEIGVAMGQKGTEAAKEAAEIVLTDDNFASITAAVREGRTVYQNIKKSILFMLPTNGAQTMAIMLAVIVGALLPITPLQILWVNTVTTVALALALAFEGHEPGIMQKPPRKSNEPIMSTFMAWRITMVSLLLMIGVFGYFKWYRMLETDIQWARSVAVNLLVMGEAVYLINSRKIFEPCWRLKAIIENKVALVGIFGVICLQLVFTYLWFMQYLFDTTNLLLHDWGWLIAFSIAFFMVIELEKAGFKRAGRSR